MCKDSNFYVNADCSAAKYAATGSQPSSEVRRRNPKTYRTNQYFQLFFGFIKKRCTFALRIVCFCDY